MPIELAHLIPDDYGIEQQSDCDSAADIELENLDVLSLRMTVDLRDNTCKIPQCLQQCYNICNVDIYVSRQTRKSTSAYNEAL